MSHIHIDENKAFLFINNLLVKAGVDSEISNLTAKGLVHTSLHGVDTHGIRLLPHYLNGIEAGRINKSPVFSFLKTSPSTGIFDADHTLGYAAGMVAMQHAIDIAKNSGVGFVSVKNSSHCGALSYYGFEAAKHNMIGLGFTHATSRMKAPGSNEEFFGTNPMCFTAPMSQDQVFCYDSAPTLIPFHKVIHHKETNKPLPQGAAADKYGNETIDPQAATQLLPMSGYKGFGLAMIADILSGLMTGMPVGRQISKMYGDMSEKRYLGHFFGVIRIDAFENPKVFKDRLRGLSDEVRNLPKKDSYSQNYVPGDPEQIIMKKRKSEGIPISEDEWQKLISLADKYELIHPEVKPQHF